MGNSYHTGLWAEMWAAAYLLLRGYRLRAWRYKTPVGEIDLIAQHRGVLVFVEVKARPGIEEGLAAIRPASHIRLRRAAMHYLARWPQGRGMPDCRFDLVVVTKGWRIRHLDNVMLAGS